MTAFPSLTGRDRERMAARGVNPDRSLYLLLRELSGPQRAKELMLAQPDLTPAAFDVELTDRELAVLRLYANGEKESAVASELGLSHHTVYGHARNMRQKLGARTIPHAVHLAHEYGLL